MKKTLISICAVLAALVGFAATWTDPDTGIAWTYTVSNGKAEIVKAANCSGTITVPTSLGECPVTSIGSGAFWCCSGMTSVAIPDGVTGIGESAFGYCSGLTRITIPSSVTCIGRCAFYYCSGLMNVEISEGVTSIGGDAFGYCSGLTSITIPSSVASIGVGAFYGCTNLGNGVVIVDGCVLTVNGTCPSSVEIPNGTRLIAGGAFYGFSGLTRITIPSSVTSIGERAFYGCTNLGNGVVIVDGCVLTVNGTCPSSVEIPNGTRLIADGVFSGCGGLTSITIPSSVTRIGDSTFLMSGLTSITIPSSVTSIEGGVFWYCSSLTNVVIANSVTNIGNYAFYGCSRLTNVVIPEGVTSIGNSIFYGCGGLTSVTIPEGVTSIGAEAFRGCSRLTNVVIPEGVTSIENSTFYGCSGLTNVPIPEGVTSIGAEAFRGCSRLTNVVIPEGVTSIGDGAFYSSGLTSVTIPASVTSIGRAAFVSCTSLPGIEVCSENPNYCSQGGVLFDKELKTLICHPEGKTGSYDIPPSVMSIGDCAFGGCDGLTSVTIPSSVTSIGDEAFGYCDNLNAVDFEGAPPEGVEYAGIKTDAAIRYNMDYEDEWLPVIQQCGWTNATPFMPPFPDGGPYKKTVEGIEWTFMVEDGSATIVRGSGFGDGDVVIPAIICDVPVTQIATGAFSNGVDIVSMEVPVGIIYIGPGAFSGCTNLVLTMQCACPEGYEESGVLDVKEVLFPDDAEAYATYEIPSCRQCDYLWLQSALYVQELGILQLTGDSYDGNTTHDAWVEELPRTVCPAVVVYLNGLDDETATIVSFDASNVSSSYIGWTAHINVGRSFVGYDQWLYNGCLGPKVKMAVTSKIYHGVCSSDIDNYYCVALDCAYGQVVESSKMQFHQGDVIVFSGADGNFIYNGNGGISGSVEIEGFEIDDNWNLYNGYMYFAGAFHNGRFYWRVPSVQDYIQGPAGTARLMDFDTAAPYRRYWFTAAEYGYLWTASGDAVRYTVLPEYETRTVTFDISAHATGMAELTERIEKEQTGFADPWQHDWETISFDEFAYNVYGNPCRLYNAPGWDVEDGWQFAGWEDESGTFIENLEHFEDADVSYDRVFTAVYEPIVYSISYADTRSVVHDNPTAYTVQDAFVFAALDNVPGWDFAGWNPSGVTAGSFGDMVVSAQWERVYHTIEIGSSHGKAEGAGSYEYGSTVALHAPDVVWNGPLTNYVCLGTSSHLPLTNAFEVVMTNGVSFSWDVWQTNYLFRTAANPDGVWFKCGDGATETAVAKDGYRFYKWIGDVDGSPYENPKTFAMNQARYVEPVFVEEKVAEPTISIPNGTVLRNTTGVVSMTCATPGSTIYYTLDGTAPSASNGTKYTSAFLLGKTALIRAVAIKPGSDPSDEASSAVVWLAAGADLPKISITPGTSVQSAKLIKVTFAYDGIAGLATEMRYTTDGSEPTADSSLYTQWFKLAIDGTKFVKAAAFVNGAQISEVTSVRYAPSIADVIVKTGEGCGGVEIETEATHAWTIDDAVVSPSGKPSMRSGKITHGDQSSMTATFDGDGVIEFAWRTSCESGSEPEFDFYVDRAYCLLDGEEVAWLDGETDWTRVVVSVVGKGPHELAWIYEKDDADDMTYPGEDCVWVSDVKFSFAAYVMFSAGEYATGDAPDGIVSSAGYSVTMPGCGGLKYAKHAFVGWQYGDVTYAEGEFLTVDAHEMTLIPVWRMKVLPAPVIAVASEYDEESTPVTITCAEDATIHYTTDGDEPTAESPVYDGWFTVTGSATIRAIAIRDDWYDSEVSAATTVRSWTTLEDCLDAEEFALATGGDQNWIGDSTEGCVKSIELDCGETSWFTASFEGAGVVEWLYKSPTNDWMRQVAIFDEEGPHELKWEGSELWIKSLKFTSAAWASFSSDGDVTGALPPVMCSAVGYEIILPGNDGFSRSRYAFAGWSDGATLYQPGDIYTVMGNVTFAAIWTEKTLAAPKIDVLPWYDTKTTSVSISSEDNGVEFFYTTDGEDPTIDSKVYTGAFEVAGTCTIKVISVKDDYFDSDIVVANTVRAPWTINECLNNTNLVFEATGDAPWVRDLEYPIFAVSMRSGAIVNNKSSELHATVEGAGVLTFNWAASSEYDEETGEAYDGLMLYVDGDCVTGEIPLGGEVGCSVYTCRIIGVGTHLVRWRYKKDKSASMGEDCVWIANVKWVPASELPVIFDDPGAVVTGDAESGYTIAPSEGKKSVEVTIPVGVEPEKVTVVLGTDVETVKPNGANVKIVKGENDITDYLNVPKADASGAIDLTKAAVKEEIVKEALDPDKGAEIVLNAESPSLTTAETKPGLTYTLHEGATLQGMGPGDSKLGDGKAWTPNITVKGGDSGFYSIGVTK